MKPTPPAVRKLRGTRSKINKRQRRQEPPEELDPQTQLDYLRGDIAVVESLAHATAEAVNELPHTPTAEQRLKVGRVYNLAHATFEAVSKLVK